MKSLKRTIRLVGILAIAFWLPTPSLFATTAVTGSLTNSSGGPLTGRIVFIISQSAINTNGGEIVTASITAGGAGYSVNDVLTVAAPGTGGTFLVSSVSGGVVTGISLLTAGTGYTVGAGKATTVAPSGGTGCTINILSVTPVAVVSAPVTCEVVAGAITVIRGTVTPCAVYGNDVLSPANTYYKVSTFASGGPAIFSGLHYTISGSTWNISANAPNTSDVEAASAYQIIQDEGTALLQRRNLNFTGSGVVCSDSPANGRTNCTITPGTPPTGTGFRHITAGTEDAAAKLVENADVHASAAIVESKLALNFATHANTNDPTADQKAALAGTSGVPSTSNRYVTDADARNTNARTPTTHASTHQNAGGDEVATAIPAANAIPKAGAGSTLDDGWLSTNVTKLGSSIQNSEVDDDLTLTNLTQITTRNYSDLQNIPSTFAPTAHNLLSTAHGDTAAGSAVLGDLLYANVTPAWAKLAGNITTAKQFLSQTGTGSASAAPAWAAIADADIPATLTRDSEVVISGTANEIASSASGPATTLSIPAQLNLSGKEIIGGATPLKFEGATDNNIYTLISITDPTVADKTFTIPNADSVAVQPDAGAANNFLTAISSLGAISKAQPSFSNLSGAATLAQLPAGTANQVLGTNAAGTAIEHKTLSVGTTGTDFTIAHAANSVALNLPSASAANRGALASADWTTFNNKANASLGNLASVAINASLLPATDNAIDLGSATKQYRDIYLAGSLKGGGAAPPSIEGTPGVCSLSAALIGKFCLSSTNNRFGYSYNGGAYSDYTLRSDNLSVFAATTSVQLAGVISDETGSGLAVFGTSPTLTGTPLVGDGAGNDKLSFVAEATNPTCAATNYFVWGNSTDLKLKKCQNGTISDLDTTGGGTSHDLLSATHTDTTAAAVARGDVVTGQTATPKWQRLALGTTGKYLKSDGTDLIYSTGAASGTGACAANTWASTLNGDAAPTCTQPAFSNLSGSIALAQTPLTTLGDVLYANATPALARLAGNTTAAKQFLNQTGNGTISAAPVWGAIADADVPATIARDTEITLTNLAGGTAGANSYDFEGSSVTRPFRRLAFASFPGACTANREFLERSDPATAGQVVYVCNAAGTGWDLVGDGGGGGVTSYTGDGVVHSNSGSTGAVTATLATHAPNTGLLGPLVPSAAAATPTFRTLDARDLLNFAVNGRFEFQGANGNSVSLATILGNTYRYTTTAATRAFVAATATEPAYGSLLSTATGGSDAALASADLFMSARNEVWFLKGKLNEYTAQRVWFAVSSATAGTMGASATPFANYYGFRAVAGTDTNWQCAIDNASGTPTLSDSGVAVGTTLISMMLLDDTTNSTFHFYIDGVEKCAGIAMTKRMAASTAVRVMWTTQTTEAIGKKIFWSKFFQSQSE